MPEPTAYEDMIAIFRLVEPVIALLLIVGASAAFGYYWRKREEHREARRARG